MLSHLKLPWTGAKVSLLPRDREEFSHLVAARNSTVRRLEEIETEVRERARALGSDAHTISLWQGALIAGRKPEIDALAAAGRSQDEMLRAFAAERGFSSAERLAKVCRLPSPSAGLGRTS